MASALVVGNVQNIILALHNAGAKVKPAFVDRHGYKHDAKFVLGDDSACQAIMDAAHVEMDSRLMANGNERSRILCNAQAKAWGLGWKPSNLSTNIYGYGWVAASTPTSAVVVGP